MIYLALAARIIGYLINMLWSIYLVGWTWILCYKLWGVIGLMFSAFTTPLSTIFMLLYLGITGGVWTALGQALLVFAIGTIIQIPASVYLSRRNCDIN